MKKFITAILVLASLNSFALECKGVKKDGSKCKSTIVSKSTGFCGSHDPKAVKCSHVKPDGKGCGVVTKGGGKCRFHNKG